MGRTDLTFRKQLVWEGGENLSPRELVSVSILLGKQYNHVSVLVFHYRILPGW